MGSVVLLKHPVFLTQLNYYDMKSHPPAVIFTSEAHSAFCGQKRKLSDMCHLTCTICHLTCAI